MKSIIIYHGSDQIVKEPEIRIARYNKDFYFGFYCTLLEKQASRWACRKTGEGYINEFLYTPNSELNILHFSDMTEEWLDFIISCRSGKSHNYDIVEGPMADDQLYNYLQNYINGQISRSAFWELARFNHPTHQISFHSARALTTLSFIKEIKVYE